MSKIEQLQFFSSADSKRRRKIGHRGRRPVETAPIRRRGILTPRFLEFFAGSGLVAEAFRRHFRCVWANDFCPKKAAVYTSNHKSPHFQLANIQTLRGADLPDAEMAWASFPCQDLSLAGNMGGINASRSGLVWQWLRILDEMGGRRPRILVAENVLGLVSAENGKYYITLHDELRKRGYNVGAVVLNAVHWVPQSRPRVFIVAVHQSIAIDEFRTTGPIWCHTKPIQKVAHNAAGWIWWKLPKPPHFKDALSSILDLRAKCHSEEESRANLRIVAAKHQTRLLEELSNGFKVAPGYRRTRKGKQVLELRFDEVAGCLRTPDGGSSRQFLVIRKPKGQLRTRLLTARETARLMGAPESYVLPENYTDAYKAMGDAVAVPVAAFLAKHLLSPLCERISPRKKINGR